LLLLIVWSRMRDIVTLLSKVKDFC
jgi:hypothetical protein